MRQEHALIIHIFILNTVLEINASRKKLSHILFIDLTEAYDRVDRHILIRKLEQLKIPNTFVNFLKNYYFEDNISSATAGQRTRKQYQKRGLRQVCNLSSILFIIYMSELGQRMRNTRWHCSVNTSICGRHHPFVGCRRRSHDT